MLVLDAYGTPVPLVDLTREIYRIGEYAGLNEYYNLVKHQNAPLMLRLFV
jgi:hypothetical protein